MSEQREEKLRPGDVVLYDPPDLTRVDYSNLYIGSLGVVTNAPTSGLFQYADSDETHVKWISSRADYKPVSRHYTRNLRKIGHLTP